MYRSKLFFGPDLNNILTYLLTKHIITPSPALSMVFLSQNLKKWVINLSTYTSRKTCWHENIYVGWPDHGITIPWSDVYFTILFILEFLPEFKALCTFWHPSWMWPASYHTSPKAWVEKVRKKTSIFCSNATDDERTPRK